MMTAISFDVRVVFQFLDGPGFSRAVRLTIPPVPGMFLILWTNGIGQKFQVKEVNWREDKLETNLLLEYAYDLTALPIKRPEKDFLKLFRADLRWLTS